MGKIIVLIAYLVYGLFCFRFLLQVFLWYRAARQQALSNVGSGNISLGMFIAAALDVIFFRRLFSTNKLLWAASWTFHLSFLIVFLRHLRYVLNPAPDVIIFMQPAGVVAGYVLPCSLFLILIMRMVGNGDRYVSYYNFFLIGVLLMLSLTGLLMRIYFQADLIDVKDFITGILVFIPDVLPDSLMFVIHFLLALLLIAFIPFHLFAAPIVSMEARKREEGLGMVLHEK